MYSSETGNELHKIWQERALTANNEMEVLFPPGRNPDSVNVLPILRSRQIMQRDEPMVILEFTQPGASRDNSGNIGTLHVKGVKPTTSTLAFPTMTSSSLLRVRATFIRRGSKSRPRLRR
jgi:hypothetical protein